MGIFDNKRIGRVNRALLRESSDYEKYQGYWGALVAAGATVHVFQEFGDYQGTWIALVTYGLETGWINGSYGSCSGCDAFQAEFGYEKESFDKIADFGETYLGTIISADAMKKQFEKDSEWDDDAASIIKFIEEHRDVTQG